MSGISTSTRTRTRCGCDLFADVLVRADGVTYRVCDLDEFEQARRRKLILPSEADGAVRGLAELTAIIDRGDLLAFMSRACPIGPLNPPAVSPARRVPLAQAHLLSAESRAAWPGLESRRRPSA